MRILLDECVPRRLKREFGGHDIHTVSEMGWSGIKNGELLKRAVADRFEVFVTVDQNLRFQQNLQTMSIAILVFVASTNRVKDLLPLMPSALSALASIKAGDCVEIRQ